MLVSMLRETGDDGPSKRTPVHIGQRRVVDHVIAVSGTQQSEEVQLTLAAGGAEPGTLARRSWRRTTAARSRVARRPFRIHMREGAGD